MRNSNKALLIILGIAVGIVMTVCIIIGTIFGIKLLDKNKQSDKSIELITNSLKLTLRQTGNKDIDNWRYANESNNGSEYKIEFSNDDNNFVFITINSLDGFMEEPYVDESNISHVLDVLADEFKPSTVLVFDNGKIERITLSNYEWLNVSSISDTGKDGSLELYMTVKGKKMYTISSGSDSKYNIRDLLENIEITDVEYDAQIIKD